MTNSRMYYNVSIKEGIRLFTQKTGVTPSIIFVKTGANTQPSLGLRVFEVEDMLPDHFVLSEEVEDYTNGSKRRMKEVT